MPGYAKPDVGDHTVVHKGTRYWLVKMDGKSKFDLNDPKDCDYVMFDRLYGATIALVKVMPNGFYRASLLSHVELWYDFESPEQAAKGIPNAMNRYLKACGML